MFECIVYLNYDEPFTPRISPIWLLCIPVLKCCLIVCFYFICDLCMNIRSEIGLELSIVCNVYDVVIFLFLRKKLEFFLSFLCSGTI